MKLLVMSAICDPMGLFDSLRMDSGEGSLEEVVAISFQVSSRGSTRFFCDDAVSTGKPKRFAGVGER